MAIAGPKSQFAVSEMFDFQYDGQGKVAGATLKPDAASFFQSVQQTAYALTRSGPTASRPTSSLPGRWVGMPYFDTTLTSAVFLSKVNPDVWVAPGASGVTSINVSGGTTGLTFTGGPITTNGTITAGGTLGVANGGTGAATFGAGDILFGNGTSAIAVDANLTWSATTGLLTQKGISSRGAANGIGTELFGLGTSDAGTSTTTNNTVIGAGANSTRTFGTNNVVIGAGASSQHNLTTVIGGGASVTASQGLAIGFNAACGSTNGMVVGVGHTLSGGGLFCIGISNAVTHAEAASCGAGLNSQQAGELSFGSVQTPSLAPSFRLSGCTSTAFTAQNTWRVNSTWIDPALATFKSRAVFSVYDFNGEREYMRADANGSGADVFFNGASYSFNVPVKTKGYTVATLPAGSQGMMAYVTDALAPTFLAIIVGGGTVVSPVFHNGTNWVGF